ncbi:MAG: CDP-alcohol phosphatidyltransferase family protein [Candidatus Staskawiczbacteria bacterium]|nr:CDP-alcohol phosphatidyltransferase family protein [Candidatus Staskawiczbacteria bacterium]
MKNFLYDLKSFFDNIDTWRDKILFMFIKPFWPRKISPNSLSIMRILISILLFVLLFYYNNPNKALIVSLFLIGAFSDMLDGSVARGLNKVTKSGIILDPIADRMLIIPIAVYSLMNSHYWLLLLLLLLEIINMLVSMYTYSKNILVGANIFGKIKMLLQSVVFVGILIFWPQNPNEFFIYLLWISVYFIIISIFFKILDLKNHGKN